MQVEAGPRTHNTGPGLSSDAPLIFRAEALSRPAGQIGALLADCLDWLGLARHTRRKSCKSGGREGRENGVSPILVPVWRSPVGSTPSFFRARLRLRSSISCTPRLVCFSAYLPVWAWPQLGMAAPESRVKRPLMRRVRACDGAVTESVALAPAVVALRLTWVCPRSVRLRRRLRPRREPTSLCRSPPGQSDFSYKYRPPSRRNSPFQSSSISSLQESAQQLNNTSPLPPPTTLHFYQYVRTRKGRQGSRQGWCQASPQGKSSHGAGAFLIVSTMALTLAPHLLQLFSSTRSCETTSRVSPSPLSAVLRVVVVSSVSRV